MKRKHIFFVWGLAVSALIFASCASTPKAGETAPDEPITETVVENSEPVDNESILKKTESARQAAIAAKADKVAAVQFMAVDVAYNTLKTQAQDGADVSAGLEDVKTRYEALEQYAKALELKARIDELGFSSYDQASYDKGTQAAADIENLGSASNITGASMLEKAKTAYSSFNTVLITAFKKIARDERSAAFASKLSADGVKAGAAAKSEYDQAVGEFRAGDSSYSMQNPEAAYNHYKNAHVAFDSLYQTVAEKRAAAQKAIDEAKAKVEESGNYAAGADKEAPLSGDNIQGIEAEDAKLLEADNYADPEAAKADIPEEILDNTEAE